MTPDIDRVFSPTESLTRSNVINFMKMTQNTLTKMKPKGRWIDKYSTEFDEKGIIENAVFQSTEMLKLIVKPKSIWFVQHVISEGISTSDGRCLEEGEILSDGDEDQEINEIFQGSPAIGHFGSICGNSSTVQNSLHEKSFGSFRKCTTPGYGRNIHKDFNAYGRIQVRANGHGLRRGVSDHYKNSPKPDSKHNRSLHSFSKCYYCRPLIEGPWNSGDSTSSSYDRYY